MPTCKSQPYCRNCGKPIAKSTRKIFLRTRGSTSGTTAYHLVDELPHSKADCAKLTNCKVMSVRRKNYGGLDAGQGLIDEFTEWDGESYVDDLFCKGPCAVAFGRLATKSADGRDRGTVHWLAAIHKRRDDT